MKFARKETHTAQPRRDRGCASELDASAAKRRSVEESPPAHAPKRKARRPASAPRPPRKRVVTAGVEPAVVAERLLNWHKPVRKSARREDKPRPSDEDRWIAATASTQQSSLVIGSSAPRVQHVTESRKSMVTACGGRGGKLPVEEGTSKWVPEPDRTVVEEHHNASIHCCATSVGQGCQSVSLFAMGSPVNQVLV